ncbi:MAG: hypothetical protein QF732_08605 [Nitrospinaceae bacterium]|jgi:hypothetical protein|nr:hypothetical protein [Nitrospinaceae bacterium]|tara:strand:+ start:99 stop:392 length:294 start_codon:yes stop_codon:yes gene_type:complete
MDTKKPKSNTTTIQQLASGLADKPELAQRLLKIVKLANEPTESGKVRSADEVEALLVEEVRKLGNQTLSSWAQDVDMKLGKELKAQSVQTQMREKKL